VAALAAYLQTAMDERLDGVIVTPDWPDPDQPLAQRAVSVITAGPRADAQVDLSVTDYEELVPADPVRRRYRWRVKACTQGIQLDVWATSAVDRQAIRAALDEALHAGPSVTLGLAGSMPVRDGVLLALDPETGHEGFAEFTFDAPEDTDGEALRAREYRATYPGEAQAILEVVAESPRMAEIALSVALGETPEAFEAEPDREYFAVTGLTGAAAAALAPFACSGSGAVA
jgi:hypothetical protein